VVPEVKVIFAVPGGIGTGTDEGAMIVVAAPMPGFVAQHGGVGGSQHQRRDPDAEE
jgi:hypothetical protein